MWIGQEAHRPRGIGPLEVLVELSPVGRFAGMLDGLLPSCSRLGCSLD